jgi:hypothetical protein
MIRPKGIVLVWVLITCLFFLVSTSEAEKVDLSDLKIHPFISTSVGYTDNLFLTETDKESDTFFVLSPGIQLLLPP